MKRGTEEGAALQRCVDVTADGAPYLAAEPTVHEVIEVVLSRGSFEQERVSWFEERTGGWSLDLL